MTDYWKQVCSAAATIALLLTLGTTAQAHVPGCDDAVDFAGGEITVAAVDGDDAANISCALEAAGDMSVSTVRLMSAAYDVSGMIVEDFDGTLTGLNDGTTVVNFLDQSIDCAGMRADRISPAGIKFVHGKPRVERLNIYLNDPCGAPYPFYTLHFTGDTRHVNCDHDYIEASVNRVNISIPETGFTGIHGVGAFAEDDIRGGCKNRLYGSLNIKKSSFTNVDIGVKFGLKATAQVSITKNEFVDNYAAVVVFDSSQVTNISGNIISASTDAQTRAIGISIFRSREDAPNRTQFTIYENQFHFQDLVDDEAGHQAIYFSPEFQAKNTTILIAKNEIFAEGFLATGIWLASVTNAAISDNVFSGNSRTAIYANSAATPTDGTTITGNDFSESSGSLADIYLGPTTSGTIVGNNLGDPSIVDEGSGNTVIAN